MKQNSSEHYSVNIHFGECDTKDYHVLVKPLLSNKMETFTTDLIFNNLTVTQLSEFYVVSVSDGESKMERVLIVHTDGLPEDRGPSGCIQGSFL